MAHFCWPDRQRAGPSLGCDAGARGDRIHSPKLNQEQQAVRGKTLLPLLNIDGPCAHLFHSSSFRICGAAIIMFRDKTCTNTWDESPPSPSLAEAKCVRVWESPAGGTVSVFLVFLALSLGLVALLRDDKKGKNLPPGPPSLPVVGSLPFCGHLDARKVFQKLSKRYGNIFTVDFGAERTIVLSDYDLIREAYVKQGLVFSGRPHNMLNYKFRKEFGIVTNDGERWLAHKRLLLHIVRDLGWGKSSTEPIIRQEAQNLVTEFSKSNARTSCCNPKHLIQKAVTNVIISLVFGMRLSLDDQGLCRTLDAVLEAGEVLGLGGIMIMFPFLECVPIDLTGQKRFIALVHQIGEQFKIWTKEGEVSDKPNLVNAYVREAERRRQAGDTSVDMSDNQMMWTIFDICGAGIETTTYTITWALIYLIKYPEIQEKMYEEISDVIGDRPPEVRDRKSTPYTEAVISEVMRLADVTPLGVPHSTLEDTSLKGYNIPRGTTVMMNMYGVHRDPSVWQDPEVFRPTRFIDEQGRYRKRKELISFSMGKRVCFGESLARMEVYQILVTLVQHFRIGTPEGQPDPDLEGTLGVVYYPKPFDAVLEARDRCRRQEGTTSPTEQSEN